MVRAPSYYSVPRYEIRRPGKRCCAFFLPNTRGAELQGTTKTRGTSTLVPGRNGAPAWPGSGMLVGHPGSEARTHTRRGDGRLRLGAGRHPQLDRPAHREDARDAVKSEPNAQGPFRLPPAGRPLQSGAAGATRLERGRNLLCPGSRPGCACGSGPGRGRDKIDATVTQAAVSGVRVRGWH